MKRIIEKIKCKPLEAVLFFLCLFVFLSCSTWKTPALFTMGFRQAIHSHLFLGVVLPLAALAGGILFAIRIVPPENTKSVLLRLLLLLGLFVLTELVYASVLRELSTALPGQNSAFQSRGSSKYSYVLPLLKLPVYALLLCMLETVLTYGRSFCWYFASHFWGYLPVCIAIYTVTVFLSRSEFAEQATATTVLLVTFFLSGIVFRAERHQWGGKLVDRTDFSI